VNDVANQVQYLIFDVREAVATYQIEKAKANDSNLKPFLLYGAVHPFPSIRKSRTISLNRLLPYEAKLIEDFSKKRSDKLIPMATREKVNNWFTDKAGIPADILENAHFNGFLPGVS
jgi:hypothetical protein